MEQSDKTRYGASVAMNRGCTDVAERDAIGRFERKDIASTSLPSSRRTSLGLITLTNRPKNGLISEFTDDTGDQAMRTPRH